MEQKKTNREILIAALQGDPSDPEVRKILMRCIDCWAYQEAYTDAQLLQEDALCRDIPMDEVAEEVCTACKLKWLEREAIA